MFALCDVKGMYAACEKVFDPSIRNLPCAVLSNNDGCVVAVCSLARQLKLSQKIKFAPYFQIKDELKAANVVIRSSNYELYANLSQRLMDTCAALAPEIFVYSIDECFLDFGRNPSPPPAGWEAIGRNIRKTLWRNVRLPTDIGIGPTPTLAKAANHAAKRIPGFNGVAVIDSEATRKHILAQMDVTDIWGIGSKLGRRLKTMGINNALELANRNPAQTRKDFSILVENTVRELNGEIRNTWNAVRAGKKEIYSTRSFGVRITDKDELQCALANHADVIGAKLRKQKSLASAMTVFASSSPHDHEGYFTQSCFIRFTVPTSDTRNILEAIKGVMDQLYSSGVRYYRCGVGLLDLHRETLFQFDLFNQSNDKPELMKCMDTINSRFGRATVHLAAKGFEQKFQMRRDLLSPQYTTKWSDIPKIKCI
jgi:DNA polymerase V